MPVPPKNVLILDDEPSIRYSIAAFLEDEGFEIFLAESSEEALALCAQRRMDGAIVDIRLPGVDGNTFMVAAKKLNPKMRFIIHTGSADYVIPDEVRALGVRSRDVLTKPVLNLYDLLIPFR